MLFSIIMPVYNGVEYIQDSIEYFTKSDYDNYELIVVDDGSDDGTGFLCDQLSEVYPCIRVYHQSNHGVSSARNVGIEHSKGKYIIFSDADDILEIDKLSHIASIIDNYHPDIIDYGCEFEYYHNNILYRSELLVYPKEGIMQKKEWQYLMEKLFQSNLLSAVWNKAVRADIVKENDIRFNLDLIDMEDFLFNIMCLRHVETIYNYPYPLYHYRQHEGADSTYKRISKLVSLTEYMHPFEREMYSLYNTLGRDHEIRESCVRILKQVYINYFHCMIANGRRQEIIKTANDMIASRYKQAIKKTYTRDFSYLVHKEYTYLWLRYRVRALRHILVKYVRYYKHVFTVST